MWSLLFLIVQVLPIMSDFKLEAVLPGNPIIINVTAVKMIRIITLTNMYPGTQPPKGWGEKRKRPGCSGCLCRWRRRRESGGGGGVGGGEEDDGEQGWCGTQTTLLDRFFLLLILNCKTLTATYQFHDKSFVTFPYVTLHVAKNRDNERR